MCKYALRLTTDLLLSVTYQVLKELIYEGFMNGDLNVSGSPHHCRTTDFLIHTSHPQPHTTTHQPCEETRIVTPSRPSVHHQRLLHSSRTSMDAERCEYNRSHGKQRRSSRGWGCQARKRWSSCSTHKIANVDGGCPLSLPIRALRADRGRCDGQID